MCHIRPLLTLITAKMITHSVVTSRLDHANTLLHGTSAANINKLQVAQNTLARVVCQAPRSVSTTELHSFFYTVTVSLLCVKLFS